MIHNDADEHAHQVSSSELHSAAGADTCGTASPLAIPEACQLVQFTAAQLSPQTSVGERQRRSRSSRQSAGDAQQLEAEASCPQHRSKMPLELAAYAATLAQASVAAAREGQVAAKDSAQPGEASAVHRLAIAAWRVHSAAGRVRSLMCTLGVSQPSAPSACRGQSGSGSGHVPCSLISGALKLRRRDLQAIYTSAEGSNGATAALHEALQSALHGPAGAKDSAVLGIAEPPSAVEVAESPPTPSITPCRQASEWCCVAACATSACLPPDIHTGAAQLLAADRVDAIRWESMSRAPCRIARASSASSGPSLPTLQLPMPESPPETPLQLALRRPAKVHSIPPSRRITPQIVHGPARPVEAWKNLQVCVENCTVHQKC